MYSDLFKMIVVNQNKWARQYRENHKEKHLIQTICNRKYKSKGNKNIEDLKMSLLEMGITNYKVDLEERDGMIYETISLND